MNDNIFKDRSHAGILLAEALGKYANLPDVIVLGLPRGGVPVAFEVARRLNAPLDVMVVRKLGLPGWEELAMGAVSSGGVRVINEEVVRNYNITRATIEQTAAMEMEELRRREMAYRGHTGSPEVRGKIVILVDDGIATGSTIRAAVQAIRQQQPAKIVVAVPTAASDSCELLEPMVDELVALMRPLNFRAVGQWYVNFGQTTDDEVRRLLAEARAPQAAHK